MNLASSRNQARQLVSHRHFTINGRRVNIPSYILRPGDLVEIYPKSRKLAPLMESLRGVGRRAPEWLQFDASTLSGKVLAAPKRDQIDSPVEEQLIVEFYSR
jgi:small subunit ribosomal protein S4